MRRARERWLTDFSAGLIIGTGLGIAWSVAVVALVLAG